MFTFHVSACMFRRNIAATDFFCGQRVQQKTFGCYIQVAFTQCWCYNNLPCPTAPSVCRTIFEAKNVHHLLRRQHLVADAIVLSRDCLYGGPLVSRLPYFFHVARSKVGSKQKDFTACRRMSICMSELCTWLNQWCGN